MPVYGLHNHEDFRYIKTYLKNPPCHQLYTAAAFFLFFSLHHLPFMISCKHTGVSMKISKSVFKALWIFTLCILVLGAGIFLYIHHLRNALHTELTAYLDEVAQQGVGILNSQIQGDINSLKSAAAAISTYKTLENKPWTELLSEETKHNAFKRMAFVLPSGLAYLSDGFMIDLSHRDYLQKSLRGQNVVAGPLTDAVDQGTAVLLSVPVFSADGSVRGALIAAHPTEKYGQLIAADSFDGQGYSLIVKSNGDEVAVSAAAHTDHTASNIFQSPINENLDKDGKMRQDMQAGRSGMVRFYREGEGWLYVSYLPVGINDWYFLSVVPERVAIQKTKNLLWLSLILGGTLLLVFAALLLYIYLQNRHTQAVLYQKAYIDPLLHFPNWSKTRQDMQDLLTQTQDRTYAFVVFDINKFKVINDTLGYAKSNELLQYISSVLQEELHAGELFCRVQADLFAMLMLMETNGQLKNRLELINEKIVHFHPANKERCQLILSFGVCPVPQPPLTVDELLLRAVLARDTVKGNYHDVIAFYDEQLRQRLTQEQTIENNMEEALTRKEFSLLLTPIRDMQGKPVVAEGYPVWQPQGKPPVERELFLSVFTKNGFIARLDTYLAEEACRILKHWKDTQQPQVPVALEISAASLRSPYFASVLLQLTRQYNVSPAQLILQLSPQTDPADLPLLRQLAERLHGEGFKLALHHFGRGNISLDLIQNLPIDMIKMEGQFIQDLGKNPKTVPVLEAFIRMAKELQIRLVFDGVENKQQLELLRNLQAGSWSGPLAGKPQDAAHLFQKETINTNHAGEK